MKIFFSLCSWFGSIYRAECVAMSASTNCWVKDCRSRAVLPVSRRHRMGEMLAVCTVVYSCISESRTKNAAICNRGAASVGETESTAVAAVGFHSIARTTGPPPVARGSLLCRFRCTVVRALCCTNLRHKTQGYYLLCERTFFIESFCKTSTKVTPFFYLLDKSKVYSSFNLLEWVSDLDYSVYFELIL